MPTGYLYRKRITYSTTTAESSCIFYLSLSSLGNISTLLAKSDGSDILVTDLNDVALLRELVVGTFSKSSAAPKGELYFAGDALNGSTSFYVYFGNAAGSVSNSTALWTSTDHHAVYHMQATSGVEPDKTGVYDLTAQNTIARGQAGLYGPGYSIDIEKDNPGDFASTSLFQSVSDSAWTISFVTRIESYGSSSTVISRNGTGFKGIYLYISTTEKIHCYLINTYGTGNYIYKNTTNAVISAGVTYYIDVTYDGSKTAAGLKFYCNGSLLAGTVTTDGLTDTISANDPTYIGIDYVNGYNYDGAIDEFRISTVERSQPSILQQYMLKSGGYTLTVENYDLFFPKLTLVEGNKINLLNKMDFSLIT